MCWSMSVHLRRVLTEQFVVLFLIIIKKHLLTNLFFLQIDLLRIKSKRCSFFLIFTEWRLTSVIVSWHLAWNKSVESFSLLFNQQSSFRICFRSSNGKQRPLCEVDQSNRSFSSSKDHPAGMKYIHFWAPLMKWSLVGAGFGDMLRPANKLSVNQSFSLFLTAAIWSRYSMAIVPKNYMLFAVNIFLAFVGGQQLARIAHYRYTHPETPAKN